MSACRDGTMHLSQSLPTCTGRQPGPTPNYIVVARNRPELLAPALFPVQSRAGVDDDDGDDYPKSLVAVLRYD